ncbi:mCG5525, isoform CRA_a [Mus musculus]|nr:mCG5525, isoform CRA_a [Mus musculus]
MKRMLSLRDERLALSASLSLELGGPPCLPWDIQKSSAG